MKRLLIIPLLIFALNVSAGPIGVERAKELAAKFFNQNATRSTAATVELEWAGNSLDGDMTRASGDIDEALLYIFNRTDDKGFVVLSGEDSYDHVMAFSHEGGFDTKDMPESARFILSSMCDDIARARLSAPATTRSENLEYDLGVGKVVVDHKAAKWNQGAPYNDYCPFWTSEERRSVTGCVATGMAIVMRHYKWPEYGHGTLPGIDGYGERYKSPLDLTSIKLGKDNPYQWNQMPLNYITGQYTAAQGSAVAKLMVHCGLSINMAYGQNGSGSHTGRIPGALITYFGYSKSTEYITAWKNENGKYYPRDDFSYAEWIEAVERNLREFGPMNVSVSGHSIVYDGYTDKHYIKLNHGWGGSVDGFFYLPDCYHSDGGWYYPFTAAVFYMQPINNGVPAAFFQIARSGTNSGIEVRNIERFKQNEPFDITSGIIKNFGEDFNGDIATVLCDRNGKIIETLALQENAHYALNGAYYPPKSVTITKPIQPGYRIRIYYKHSGTDEWIWARHDKLRTVDEVVVCASPEEIASMTSFDYTPDTKKLTLRSSLALVYEIKDEAGNVVASGVKSGAGVREFKGSQYFDQGVVFDISKFAKGDYTVSLICGSDPYEFILSL